MSLGTDNSPKPPTRLITVGVSVRTPTAETVAGKGIRDACERIFDAVRIVDATGARVGRDVRHIRVD